MTGRDTRVASASATADCHGDARTGTSQLDLKEHTAAVWGVAFSPDGTRIVTGSADGSAKVWDVPAGPQLEGDQPLAADGRDYRLLHTRSNLWRYREGYEAARAAQDDFAARFFFNLLPPPEQENVQAQDAARQEIIQAQATADREIAAGRTQDALLPLATLSAAKPDNAMLLMKLAALEAWFGRSKEFASTCRRALAAAQDTTVAETADRIAKACCLLPSTDKPQLEAVLALARQAVQLGYCLDGTEPLTPQQAAEFLCGGDPEFIRMCLPLITRKRDDPWWNSVLMSVKLPEGLKLVLDHGADVNAPFAGGYTMLHHLATRWRGAAEPSCPPTRSISSARRCCSTPARR